MSTTSDEAPDRAGVAIPLPRPPREGTFKAARRRLRSRGRHHGLRYWLSLQGPIVLGALAGLFVPNGLVNEWQVAYDVSVQITSPWDDKVTFPWLALPLALAGWLAVPSVVGAVVAYAVTETSSNRRAKPPNDPSSGKDQGGARYIPLLQTLLYEDHGYNIPPNFVQDFVGLHKEEWMTGKYKRPEWVIAQDHWEIVVTQFLSSDVVDKDASSNRAMRQAVSKAASFLQLDRCPECPSPQTGQNGSHNQ